MFTDAWAWIVSLDYGTVPAWISGIALLLAFKIFLRDRRAGERAQADLVGVWLTLNWDVRSPTDPRVESGQVTRHIRNGSELPVEIAQVAYDVHTRWFVRDLDQWRDDFPIWEPKPGMGVIRMFSGRIRVAPDHTWESPPQDINVAHLAPAHADQLDLIEGLNYLIRWVLLTDNAGRRWHLSPSAGRPARRVRWWSRRHRDYPIEWKTPFTIAAVRLNYLLWTAPRNAVGRLVRTADGSFANRSRTAVPHNPSPNDFPDPNS